VSEQDQPDLYISADIEADGPIPGPFSMLSMGLCVTARFDGSMFTPYDPRERTFYAELKPISDRFDSEALRVTRLDRNALAATAETPRDAMTRAAGWVNDVAGDDRPVLVGFPASFDWMFIYWYFVNFCEQGSPFAFSSVLDMKTMYQQRARIVVSRSGKDDLPDDLILGTQTHTHNALDDAVEQAELFVRLWDWLGDPR